MIHHTFNKQSEWDLHITLTYLVALPLDEGPTADSATE